MRTRRILIALHSLRLIFVSGVVSLGVISLTLALQIIRTQIQLDPILFVKGSMIFQSNSAIALRSPFTTIVIADTINRFHILQIYILIVLVLLEESSVYFLPSDVIIMIRFH